MYKLTTSSKDSNDFPFGFDRSLNRRKDELAPKKNVKREYHLKIMLKNVFGFAECQEKTTCGLGYNLTITKIKDEAVLDKARGTADARIKIDHLHWYVPHYTPSIQQQSIISKQIKQNTHRVQICWTICFHEGSE